MKAARLLFIVGPTASGKTELSIREAERIGASILSCDSLCVYRGMDIGTAKPTLEERQRVPHFGLDLCDPADPFSIAEYIRYRDAVLEEQKQSGKPIIVAGGSGFYLKSFFYPVMDEIQIPEEVKRCVEAISREAGLPGLMERLRQANPPGESFPGLDTNNPRRVEKALIRCLASGASYSQLLKAFASQPNPLADWTKEVWLVRRSSESLGERNRNRVRTMLEAGLLDEVQALRAAGFEKNPGACKAIGYREALDYLDGLLDFEQMRENIIIHTNQLMRKQRTWFRHQLSIDREVDPDSSLNA